MRKKTLAFLPLLVFFSLCLTTFSLSSSKVLVRAQPNEVWVGLPPSNYTTIQEAINAVENGTIVHVKPGVYKENVRLNKSITLIGEDTQTTIIDGNYSADALDIVNIGSDGAEVRNITARNPGPYGQPGGGWSGILVSNSVNVRIYYCLVKNCTYGLELRFSSLIEAGYNTITNGITNGSEGIRISTSGSCLYYANNVSYNNLTINIRSTTGLHTFYRNNIMNNTNQRPYFTGVTSWDNGAEGNYWSDYTGTDSDGDGIGDTSGSIPQWGVDYYPLIEPWSLTRVFNVSAGGGNYNVTTFSNTTIASFGVNASLRQMSFNSTAPNATIGFCNVTIPKALMWGSFNVTTGGQSLVAEKTEDGNFTYLSFYYNLSSTKTIAITSSYAVPEFQLASLLAILFLASLCILVLKRRKKLRQM